MLNLALVSAAAFLNPAPAAPVALPVSTNFYSHDAAEFQRRDERRAYREGRRDGRREARNNRYWRGNDGRYYCRRDNGTTGLLVGAGVGALAGNAIAGRGDKTLGAVIGGLGGAAIGREIDRGNVRCR